MFMERETIPSGGLVGAGSRNDRPLASGSANPKPLTEVYYVVRTLRLLEMAAFGGLTTQQIAHGLQIHQRTARRMIQRLCDEHYLVREEGPSGRYELTMHLPALGAQALAHARLPRVAAPVLEGLHARTGLTATLAIPCYDAVLCVAQRASDVGVDRRAGELFPCHCTAAGKVLLAERPAWAATRLAQVLARFTGRTITDASSLREQLASIREAGFAVEDREYRESTHAVAAPVDAAHDGAVAAVAVSADEPFDPSAVVSHILAAARDIGATLGAPRAARPGEETSLRVN
jgi:DNA-binding IclR family transcriptional regulator